MVLGVRCRRRRKHQILSRARQNSQVRAFIVNVLSPWKSRRRFRVIGEKFTDINPSIKKTAPTTSEEKPIAYRVLASIGEQGLGCIDWWTAEDADESDDENVKMEVDGESGDDDAEEDSGDE